MKLSYREKKNDLVEDLLKRGFSKTLANILASRKISSADDCCYDFNKLLAPNLLKDCIEAGNYLADALLSNKKIFIVGDYDADGATATATAIKGLNLFGFKNVDFLIPSRFKSGYGLSPEIVDEVKRLDGNIIITVDNGIGSFQAIDRANTCGIDVIITDHHLQAEKLPNAKFIVNPNRIDCNFPSKNLCGVGVVFYLLISIRKALRDKNYFNQNKEANLLEVIDLVALGTIADLVPLDFNNRLIVNYGLKKIRSNQCNEGIKQLLILSNKNFTECKTTDLSFSVAPKINAAGRMNDMSIGVRCLISSSPSEVISISKSLMNLNYQRRETEHEMTANADDMLKGFNESNLSICLYNSDWHQGIVGILASRIKEKFKRPTIIFSEDDDGYLKGSGRSISSIHLRDVIDKIYKKNSNNFLSFGGHAMAAGVKIKKDFFIEFSQNFEIEVSKLIDHEDLDEIVNLDESLLDENLTFDLVKEINEYSWGQDFPAPIFRDSFDVIEQNIVAEKHLKLILRNGKQEFEGIYFNRSEGLPDKIKAVYSLNNQIFRNKQTIQVVIKAHE
ncbi:MAG: single-stranded-DNA-specific exonuclease RecJ [Nitrosomonadales bacterium]